jgi:ribosomal protein S18 acetylase RimI-like enzyme
MELRTFNFDTDYEAVLALWQSAGPGVHVGRSDTPTELRKKLARDPELFVVAEAGGAVVGSVIGGFDGRRGMVYHLAVAPEFRNQGLGKALMVEVEARLAALGCVRSFLMVAANNTEVLDFYARQGWKEMNTHILGKDLDTHPR